MSLSSTTERAAVRLDEFRGDVDPLLWRTTTAADRMAVSQHEPLWLPTAQRVVVVAADRTHRGALAARQRRDEEPRRVLLEPQAPARP